MGARGITHDQHAGPSNARHGAAPPTRQELTSWIDSLHLTHFPSCETVEEFVAELSQRRRRPLRLVVSGDLPVSVCGVWVAKETADLIVVDVRLCGARRDLVVLHEVAHILLGHGAPVLAGADNPREIDPDDRHEWQAEWLATYLLTLTRGLHRGSWVELPAARRAAALLGGWR